ncbi:MAG TPA: tRNA (adenosine(37)-N6)-threonylcarbamoyltransferase complex transferase subunit TsaD [Tepidisphaeraceae bacterium]|jgi:N6-L-threonylcarbamoyladenine synthase|nr:tRNA (adenosine(37)-N6)-threonylcarbamoyltransferase complex transferase subunit TsaD [Tepidisphaeraceae bacterium]
MSTILGIESTCDETAAAIVVDGFDVKSNVVATQDQLHAKYRGVVPEIASRAHIENIIPVIREAVEQAGLAGGMADVDAIAVAHRPGLIGSLLIGVTAAKTLAWALGKPLIGVDHVHAHLYSVKLENNVEPVFPAVGLVCSGGHTAMYAVRDWLDVELIGSTIDDAVGEAYDKVAAILGLGYPGGPVVDRLAALGDPKAVRFPRTTLGKDSLDFSFSGLKTAVLYHVRGVPRRGENFKANAAKTPVAAGQVNDIAAGFQGACVDVIFEKLKRAVRVTEARTIIVGGGVSANGGLRARLARFPLPVRFPAMRFCTDNAAMSAGLGFVHFRAGQTSALDMDAITYSRFARETKRRPAS